MVSWTWDVFVIDACPCSKRETFLSVTTLCRDTGIVEQINGGATVARCWESWCVLAVTNWLKLKFRLSLWIERLSCSFNLKFAQVGWTEIRFGNGSFCCSRLLSQVDNMLDLLCCHKSLINKCHSRNYPAKTQTLLACSTSYQSWTCKFKSKFSRSANWTQLKENKWGTVFRKHWN